MNSRKVYGLNTKKTENKNMIILAAEIVMSIFGLYLIAVLDYFFSDLIFLAPSASGLFVFLFSRKNLTAALWTGFVSIVFVIILAGTSLSGLLIMFGFLIIISLLSVFLKRNSFIFVLIMFFFQIVMLKYMQMPLNAIQIIPVIAVFALSLLLKGRLNDRI